jgi:xanthine dehydrogenase YagS FAD-binding subunit
MKNFDYYAASDYQSALGLAKEKESEACKFLAGGTSLVDLMRENIENPEAVIDLSKAPGNIYKSENNELVIGASVTNTRLAADPLVLEHLPFLSTAILSGASGQIRNMATVGGNILQRTRCYYFYDETAACNKRRPGSGCDALDGHNRIHAILGGSDSCIATHPSDMCVALAALDARICIEGLDGTRQVNINDFYCLPGDTPHLETVLKPAELISEIRIPLIDFTWCTGHW